MGDESETVLEIISWELLKGQDVGEALKGLANAWLIAGPFMKKALWSSLWLIYTGYGLFDEYENAIIEGLEEYRKTGRVSAFKPGEVVKGDFVLMDDEIFERMKRIDDYFHGIITFSELEKSWRRK